MATIRKQSLFYFYFYFFFSISLKLFQIYKFKNSKIKMFKRALIYLYINLGSEMVYIIQQRLIAQNICKVKAERGILII